MLALCDYLDQQTAIDEAALRGRVTYAPSVRAEFDLVALAALITTIEGTKHAN